jgi:hypothetical protein
MMVPIEQQDIDNMDLALKTEDSQIRFYLNLNPVLTRGNDENIENTSAAYQPA